VTLLFRARGCLRRSAVRRRNGIIAHDGRESQRAVMKLVSGNDGRPKREGDERRSTGRTRYGWSRVSNGDLGFNHKQTVQSERYCSCDHDRSGGRPWGKGALSHPQHAQGRPSSSPDARSEITRRACVTPAHLTARTCLADSTWHVFCLRRILHSIADCAKPHSRHETAHSTVTFHL
jgi:hypothetical protein